MKEYQSKGKVKEQSVCKTNSKGGKATKYLTAEPNK